MDEQSFQWKETEQRLKDELRAKEDIERERKVKELETKLKMYENMKDVSVSISNGPKQRPNLSETTSVYTKLLSLVLYHSIAYVLIYVLL